MSKFHGTPFTTRQCALLAVFTLSGFTGLIYESIWSHYLKLFLGHAAYAQTLVLAIFMGGMAVGAMAVGRNSLRIRRLLLAYAVVELAIGVLGLLFHTIFHLLQADLLLLGKRHVFALYFVGRWRSHYGNAHYQHGDQYIDFLFHDD